MSRLAGALMPAMTAVLLAAAARAESPGPAPVPRFEVDPSLQPAAEARDLAERAWRDLEAWWRELAGEPVPRSSGVIRMRTEPSLVPGHGGMGRPGSFAIRQDRPGQLDPLARFALRHEMAHQFLWAGCSDSGGDVLLQEAFAMATSGELSWWTQQPPMAAAEVAAVLRRTPDLNSSRSRQALAWALDRCRRELGQGLPPGFVARLRMCARDRRLPGRATLAELLEPTGSLAPPGAPALVVLDLRSGDLVRGAGPVDRPVRFPPLAELVALAGLDPLPEALRPMARGESATATPLELARAFQLAARARPALVASLATVAAVPPPPRSLRGAYARGIGVERSSAAGWAVAVTGKQVGVLAGAHLTGAEALGMLARDLRLKGKSRGAGEGKKR